MNLLLLLLFSVGTVVSFSSCSYFGLWVGLEISMLAVYPCFVFGDNSEVFYTVGFKYFVAQVVSSVLIIVGYVVLVATGHMIIGIVFCFWGLIVNFGGVFIGWIASLLENVSWLVVWVVLGAQNVPVLPLLISMYVCFGEHFIIGLGIILSSSSFISWCIPTIRAILVFSSNLSVGWICCSICTNLSTAMCYFILYTWLFSVLCVDFGVKSQGHSALNLVFYGNEIPSMVVGLTVFAMSGIPPFAVFFCNAEVLSALVSVGHIVECLILVVLSVFLIYMYVNLVLVSLFLGNLCWIEQNSMLLISSMGLVNALYFLIWGLI